MREICRASLGDKGEGYHALKITDLSDVDPDAPLCLPRLNGDTDLQAEVEQQKAELEEVAWQCEALEKELHDSHFLLGDTQCQLKDVKAWGRMMEDDLVKIARDMVALKVELTLEIISDYKELPSFKLGLQ
ncbi:hypothetical protein B296_00034963 [Ensete ventricosum]|uniref:Uncharacterized protein n=1 Tax=Ensete ventricosum TaxID=4639 RepID=A0A426X0E5_ENSVE|nr:hypothetical protein B296_00034963 [Ensete ventricosum]